MIIINMALMLLKMMMMMMVMMMLMLLKMVIMKMKVMIIIMALMALKMMMIIVTAGLFPRYCQQFGSSIKPHGHPRGIELKGNGPGRLGSTSPPRHTF